MAARFTPPRHADGRLVVRTTLVDRRPDTRLEGIYALLELGRRLQPEPRNHA